MAKASGLHVHKSVDEAGTSFQFTTNGVCSCGLMAKRPDSRMAPWILDPGCLEGLVAALELLAKGGKEVRFWARWLGEPVNGRKAVTLAQMLGLIRSNNVGRSVSYVIRAHG